jgi:regulator of ribonuclease activity A
MTFKTADLCDDFADQVSVVEPGFADFGGNTVFCGPISTIKCYEDNSKVRQQLSTPGNGRVLVVDAGGSKRCAMLGDILADKGVQNGWAGVVMYGLIRDSHDIGQMPIGVKALGTHPQKSEKKDIGEIDVSVHFGGVTFIPGNYLYADHDGIIVSENELPLNT